MVQKTILNRNIILIIGGGRTTAQTIIDFNKAEGNKYRLALMYEKKVGVKLKSGFEEMFDITLPVDFKSARSIVQALKPYEGELLAVTCRSEARIPFFQKIIPYVPYLRTPTIASLEWSTDKVLMRKQFAAYDNRITPKFQVVTDAHEDTIQKIEANVGFPLVVKPAGLAQSMLVTICYHPEELEKNLKRVFRKINSLYKELNGRGKPQVLVEQFMEGQMYSTDVFVNSRGKVYFTPMVSVKTGREIGFDDFFGYQQMTPTLLSKESIADAHEISRRAIHALGLRSSTAHVEVMKTEKGWKVIEIGPRVGGFRYEMYKLAYGIDIAANDIYIRMPKVPVIPKRVNGYTAVIKYFAKTEGEIITLKGIKKIQELESFHSIQQNKKIGELAVFAKHGGKSIFNMIFFNKDRSELLADIRRMEQSVKVEIGKIIKIKKDKA